MTHVKKVLFLLTISLVVLGCKDELEQKKTKLIEKQNELANLKSEIKTLEQEIAQLDSTFVEQEAEILVATMPVTRSLFRHQIEVRGTVQSRKNVLISAETMGRVEAMYVKEGDNVKAGQLLLKIDDDVISNNIAEVKTQLELATTVFERQKNLWDQKIGTEIQYLQAKNNKESLERRLQTLQSQLSQYYVRAPFSGNVDAVAVKQGEMAQPGLPLIRVVNLREMYIQAMVSEAYLGKFSKGDEVEVDFPVQNRTFKTTISAVSQVINVENRTFTVEIALPVENNFAYQPNQVVVAKLTDYEAKDAIAIPSKLIQTDADGKFVYVIKEKEGKKQASKVRVQTGLNYNSRTEIVAGLKGDETLIEQGYRDVNEGVDVKLASR
jgi:RND family efflux transporter MFP subunit